MENIDDENFFSFTNNSILTYKKYHFNLENLGLNINNNLSKYKYHFDVYTNQFIYYIHDYFCIFNSKGNLVKKFLEKDSHRETKKYSTCEKSNNMILYINDKNKVKIINNELQSVYKSNDPKVGKLGFLQGAFFISLKNRTKEDKKQEGQEYLFGIICNHEYRIISLIIKDQTYNYSNLFVSPKVDISEHYYNDAFNVLILRNSMIKFSLVNLKSSACFSSYFELDIQDVLMTSQFYFQRIYNKLYFIHFTENCIVFYRLNNVKNIKKKIITFNKSEKVIDYEMTKMQFYNNLVIIYFNDNIRVYDIKANFSKKFGKIDVPIDKRDGYLHKFKINNKFVFVNDDIYKIKFLPDNYYKEHISNIYETFFDLLRRTNNKKSTCDILVKIIENYELSIFFKIMDKIIENYAKSKMITYDDKKNPNEISYLGHNAFFLLFEDIFYLFKNEFQNIDLKRLFQIMIIIYSRIENKKLLSENDKDVIFSLLFNNLIKINDFSVIDNLIKNKIIPLNKTLGFIFIRVCKIITDVNKKNELLSFGLDILLNNQEKLETVINELSNIEYYGEIVNLLSEYYYKNKNKSKKKKSINNPKDFFPSQLDKINKGNFGKTFILDDS